VITLPESGYDVVGSIVTFRTDPAEVARAIRQFASVPLRTHLCIIDNSPEPLDLSGHDPRFITVHHPGANLGYGRAHNIALRAARGHARYSLVMNTDIQYAPEVVLRLVQVLDARPRAALAAPQVRYPDGSLQHVCRLLPTPANLFLRRFLPSSALTRRADDDYELRWWDHASIANIPYFQGSFILLRTETATAVGGFDERFFLYGEDIDLTRRLHAFAETLYVPDVSITHEYRRYSKHTWLGTWYGIQNNARYFNKWGWFFDAERTRMNRAARAALRTGG
jgi:GT2 family glycosyltransferase